MTPTRILLVQADARDAFFLKDALDECALQIDVTQAETLEDALALLAATTIDLILLDLDLPGSRKSWTFLPVQAIAPHVPVILLVDAEHAGLAARLVREGAQDYLVKSEIDCIPLQRAIANAIERHRLLEAARADGVVDPPTGLLNSRGFLIMGEFLRQVALEFDTSLHLHVAFADVEEPEERNLIMLGLTDEFRAAAGPLHAIARIDKDRVAALVVGQKHAAGRADHDRIELNPNVPITLDIVDGFLVRT